MILNIHYANTAPTPWIESTLREGLEELSDRLGGLLIQHIRILFEVVNGKAKPGKDLYRIKIFGYSAAVGRFEIQKTAGEAEDALRTALDTARKILVKRKFGSTRHANQRRLVLAPI